MLILDLYPFGEWASIASEIKDLFLSKYSRAPDIDNKMPRKWSGIHLLEKTIGVMLKRLFHLFKLNNFTAKSTYVCI